MGKRAWGSTLLILLLAGFALALTAGCGEQAKSMDPPKIADYNEPGTVFIATKFKADVTINDVTFDESAMEQRAVAAALAGQTGTDEASIANWLINDLLTNPSIYIKPAPTTISYPDQESDPIAGSGFIVNSDGYVVTNAHVVKMDDNELKQTMAISVLNTQVEQELSDIESALGVTLDDDQANAMAEALATAHAQYMTVENPSSESWMLMGGSANPNEADKGMPAEIVKVGDQTPGKDVAILKVEASNLPTVTLGDDSSMRDGDQAIAIGYPGAATFNPLIKQSEENIKPSMTTGIVSGRKKMDGGWDALQIDTAITHGNSGGPLFNSKGEVVGVTTFGSVNSDQTQEVQGFNFAVPVSIVKEFLNEANVTATPGQLTKTYEEGIDLAGQSHYSAAKEKFRQVADANADYPYVNDQIADATSKISAGEDKSTFPVPVWLIVLIAVVVVAAIAGSLFFLKRGKGGKAPAMSAPAVQAAAAPPVAPQAEEPETIVAAPEPGAQPVPEAVTETIAGPAAAEPASAPEPQAAPAGDTPVSEPQPQAAPEEPQAAEGPAEETQTAVLTPDSQESPEGTTEPAATEAPAFCAYCGKPLPGEANFCPSCSKPVSH